MGHLNENELASHREGYINDYISGALVKANPEEIEATQVFSKILVEDFGYPKECIQTRPQYHVKIRPSDTKKEYPVDIAVFDSSNKSEENIRIIVECKQKSRKDGVSQLENYLSFSNARIGVWYNGDERHYLHKTVRNDGQIIFEEIPNIPKFGQRLEDIGQFLRKDLKPTHNLKSTFKALRGYMVANATGTNRDEIIAQQLINIVFCKIYDERFTSPNDMVNFRIGINEHKDTVKQRILNLFESVKKKYREVIDISDEIKLSSKDICYIVGELQGFSLIESERDVVADAFETFVAGALKGGQGQFFTPRNVVKLIVNLVNPQMDKTMIDPACGTGGFLVESLRYIWLQVDKAGKDYNWTETALAEEKKSQAIRCINGIEKDDFLCKVAKAYMAILGDGKGGLFCEDTLEKPSDWKQETQQQVSLGKYNYLLANPPFGKDIKVIGIEKLSQYDLAYKYKKHGNTFIKTNKLEPHPSIQMLFLERCIKLLCDGGTMGIILPETYFHASSMQYIMQYISDGNNIKWIIDLPHNTFRPHNNAKCLAFILQKGERQQEYINMAVAEEIGHDHLGKPLYRWDYEKNCANENELWDDIPYIINEASSGEFSKYCFKVKSSEVAKKKIYVPRYYWKSKMDEISLHANSEGMTLVPISELISKNIISYFDGHGSPESETKGKGDIPYIRVKDIVNWEIYKDPTSLIPEETFSKLWKSKKTLYEKDIAYVRRGSYRIGSVAMISPYDTKAIYTREILILRVVDQNNDYNITPYYLLYLLSHHITQAQAKNKIFMDTTLPNIADRWKELRLPISNDINQRREISEKIRKVIELKWESISKLKEVISQFGNLTT